VNFCCDGSHIEVVVRLVDTLLHDRCFFLLLFLGLCAIRDGSFSLF
jgi:hypothetical protein